MCFLPSLYTNGGAGEVTTEAALAASNLLTLLYDSILSETVEAPGMTWQAATLWTRLACEPESIK